MKKRKFTRRTYRYQIREHPKNKRLGNMLDDLCDVHNHFLNLENRYYRICGSDHDRDINAAINILRAACDPVVEQT
jgi:hypothetical protein